MNRIALITLAAALAVGCGKDENNKSADMAGTDMTAEADMGGENNTTPDMNVDPNNNTPDMAEPVDMRREPPTCGPFAVAAEFVEADATGAFYYADSSADLPTDSLGIEIYEEPAVGTYALGDNYETCVHCVLIYADCTLDSCGKTLLATSGTLEITEVGGEGDRFIGSLSDVQFEEVTIDETTFASTPVPAGELRCVDSYSFDVFIGTTCAAEGEPCELDRAVDDANFTCVDDGTGVGICAAATPPLTLPAICNDTAFAGQIGAAGTHDGGVYTDVAYTNDAGLQAVWNAIPTGTDAVTDLTATPVAVTGAIVTATAVDADANWSFWVQDMNVALHVALTDGAGAAVPVAMDVKVGQAVSFSATMVETAGGHPLIKEITGFAIDSEGNDVYVMEKFDADITAADYGKIVRVGGVLGTPAACGTDMCFPLTHGAASDKTVSFRTAAATPVETDCAVFVGPATGDPGPKDAGGITAVEIAAGNAAWVVVPTP